MSKSSAQNSNSIYDARLRWQSSELSLCRESRNMDIWHDLTNVLLFECIESESYGMKVVNPSRGKEKEKKMKDVLLRQRIWQGKIVASCFTEYCVFLLSLDFSTCFSRERNWARVSQKIHDQNPKVASTYGQILLSSLIGEYVFFMLMNMKWTRFNNSCILRI